MKNYIIIGLLILMSFSAGSQYYQNMITPARPKSIVVEPMHRSNVKAFAYKYYKAGFIIKSVVGTNDVGEVIVIMEKY